MEIVFWICAGVALLTLLAYATIAAFLLAAKYRMTQVAAPMTSRAGAGQIVDLRYRTH